MSRLPAGLAVGLALVLAGTADAQQGSVQLSGAAQTLTGEPGRLGGQSTLEPDLGITWLQPGSRFGMFEMELRGTSRLGQPRRGRSRVAVSDAKFGGLTWTVEGGDAYFSPSIGQYRFSNLFTPAVTFAGGLVAARSARTSFTVVSGRATAMRNIFGTDPDLLGQTLAAARLAHRATDRVELTARASRIRTTSLKEFDFTAAASDQAGGGFRLRLTPAIDIVADGNLVSYRRAGSPERERDASLLLGTSWLLARGWLQLNASRFSAGEFPVLNNALQDREGMFAAGEYDVASRLRAFAGWDVFRSNLNPEASAAAARPRPEGVGSRVFGGLRVQVAARSTVTLRAENGARVLRPVATAIGLGLDRESDTGSLGAEWQGTFGRVTSFVRYSFRDSVDRESLDATFSQQDTFGQLFVNLSRTTQLFGLANVARNTTGTGAETIYWQAGGGAQLQPFRRSLWLRVEGTASGNADVLTGSFVPRQSVGLGVNGQLNSRTSIGFNVYADRAPLQAFGGSPWLTRSTIRLTQTLPTGRVRLAEATAPGVRRSRATASVTGSVFADWNGDGVLDPGEGPLADIPMLIGEAGSTRSSREGRFAFLNVPAGLQYVSVDVGAVPVDYDPPQVPSVQLELADGETKRLDFGLIPLGTVRGRIVRDDNNNGAPDADDGPIDGAVVVLDGGARSERAQDGRFSFAAVRSGAHVVQLLAESLPDGAAVRSEATVPVTLSRERLSVDVTFLVAAEKRQEIRRVFPAADSSNRRAASQPARAPGGGTTRPAAPAARDSAGGGRMPPRSAPPAGQAAGGFSVQIAALRNAPRARSLVIDLQAGGFPAYLVEADAEGLTRVRVGPYDTRAAARGVADVLEKRRGEKPWIVPNVRER